MTRAVGYCRVSLDKQAARGMSLEAQRAKIEAYCQLHDLELAAVEVDAGESAGTLDRPALQRAMTLLRKGAADALVVVKVDRLTRSLRDLQDLVDFFRSPKRQLHSVTEHVDTSSAMGRGFLNMMASMGQIEREAIGERTAAVMAHMRATNRYTGGEAPFGWALTDKGGLVEVAEQQADIARAVAYKGRGLTVRGVAEMMGWSVGRAQRVLAAAAKRTAP